MLSIDLRISNSNMRDLSLLYGGKGPCGLRGFSSAFFFTIEKLIYYFNWLCEYSSK